MNKKSVTIADIAALAETSVTTVSRVLSNAGFPVRQELRSKILRIAQEAGYAHKAQKRTQAKRHIEKEIGIIVPNLTNPYYAMLLGGANKSAARNGFTLLLCNTQREADREADFVDSLMRKGVRGVIAVSVQGQGTHLKRYLEQGNCVVSVEQDLPLACMRIDFNYYESGSLAARHLFGLGHRRFAFFSAPVDRHSRKELKRGYLETLLSLGVGADHILFLEAEHEEEVEDTIYEFQNGCDLLCKMLTHEPLPTAIFCNNDMTAFGAMQALQKKGYSLPEDFSIIGFDNIPFCQVITPTLTTIDQCTAQIGFFACDTLIKRLTGELTASTSMLFEPTLVERASAGRTVLEPV